MRLIAAGILLSIMLMPCTASADYCDTAFGQASATFQSASDAFHKEDYATSERLYNEAAKMYESVSTMTGCRCPKIAGSSRRNVEVSRKNAQISVKNSGNNQQSLGGLTARQTALLCAGQPEQSPQEQQSSAESAFQDLRSDPARYFNALTESPPER